MKPRSPVLGYNHNVRYAARTWHVQTEDSGVQAPHVYTHLFHEGTILASKKSHYDPTSEVAVVQKLMQTQHKHMLRELKSGAYDDKIVKIYGPILRDPGERADTSPDLLANDVADRAVAADEHDTNPGVPPAVATPAAVDSPPTLPRPPSPEHARATGPHLPPLLPPPAAQPPTSASSPSLSPPPAASSSSPRVRQVSLTPARPAVAVTARSGVSVPASTPPPTIGERTASASVPRSAPPTIGSSRSGAGQSRRPSPMESIIVGRPAVIVGKDADKRGDAADFWKTTERRQPEPSFGGDLISEKSLDEVILAYLSEDAPKK